MGIVAVNELTPVSPEERGALPECIIFRLRRVDKREGNDVIAALNG
ncbi:hypothetical protein BraRD5C2_16800 [Bradyrhizobium sp. RD5-C2]|nr:hypothetical protein BraRD5C2_16800 [Bradyrhizobium sp. RD5-C2]